MYTYREVNNQKFIKNFKSNKKISEILHDAADKYLSEEGATYSDDKTMYSCVAVLRSIIGTQFNSKLTGWGSWKKHPQFKQILSGLKAMGLKTDYIGEWKNAHELPIQERQQMRYGWLKMAAMLAEEQEQRGEI